MLQTFGYKLSFGLHITEKHSVAVKIRNYITDFDILNWTSTSKFTKTIAVAIISTVAILPINEMIVVILDNYLFNSTVLMPTMGA